MILEPYFRMLNHQMPLLLKSKPCPLQRGFPCSSNVIQRYHCTIIFFLSRQYNRTFQPPVLMDDLCIAYQLMVFSAHYVLYSVPTIIQPMDSLLMNHFGHEIK